MIHPDTKLGYVRITVSNLERSLEFYQNAIGFQIHQRENKTARLGAGNADILVLEEQADAKKVRRAPGLYHFAILVPSRHALAMSLKHFADTETPLGGFADHLVSEAIYLDDPDGNGIEVYRDRPRAEWYDERGKIKMATDPLDVRSVLSELDRNGTGWSGLEPGTRLGHMHLKVSHIPDAEEFYTRVLGFDSVMRYGPSALFVSAGGYHHHIGMNTWESAGAPPPPANAIGLREFEIKLSSAAELGAVIERVQKAGVAIEERDEGVLVRDPSQNGIVLVAPA